MVGWIFGAVVLGAIVCLGLLMHALWGPWEKRKRKKLTEKDQAELDKLLDIGGRKNGKHRA